jgi:tetratricopeptide (TPR) repeat protein
MKPRQRVPAAKSTRLPGLSAPAPEASWIPPASARRFAEKIISPEPDRSSALHEKALRQYQQGRFADAAASLTAALRVDPRRATAWSDLGVVHAAIGRTDLAMGCYDRALELEPDHAGAIGNRGNALSALRRPSEALACHDRAIALAPGNAENLNNRGGALRELGRLEEALDSFDRALALKPNFPDASSNRGNTLVDLGRAAEALASFDAALRRSPKRADIHNNRGAALARLGRARDALASFDEALALNPEAAGAHNNRGEALRALGRFAEAAEALLRALALEPNFPEALNNLGNTLMEMKRPADALTAYDAALRSRPDFVPALGNRARALLELKRTDEAVAACDRALAVDPRDHTAHNARGVALTSLGREAEALEDFDAAIAARPACQVGFNNKGLALIQIGRIAEGAAALQEALRRAPRNARAYYNLTLAKHFEPGDPAFAALTELVGPSSPLDAEQRVVAHFALAKALADAGDFDSSFDQLSKGNAGKRAMTSYDENAALGAMARARSVFGPEVRVDGGCPSPLPVFIIGMPRSGTSLVEQILACHPEVHGAGEISDFELAARDIGGAVAETVSRPEAIRDVTPDQLFRLGADYVERIRRAAPAARRVVNKMPENFRVAGLIALALPNARIIHVDRDPRDTCFSCFATLFTEYKPYAYDLGELGRFHRGYRSLMAGWREALPAGMMLDARYEDLVADLEGQARRLVEHCGLAWDANCLEFHRSARGVRTASVAQVRRPIYASSVGRWRAYERFLGPLFEALEIEEPAASGRT